MPSERDRLLDAAEADWNSDPHVQFCILVGVPPSLNLNKDIDLSVPPSKSLYGRATRHLADQRVYYYTTAALSNTLLLGQVVLGAALTALGASASNHRLITAFGAANTIIAGLVAYLKSRGQPMRARMFLDDLERVVGEIENSEIMWLGVAHHADGYGDLGEGVAGHSVTVRSEVARLTRLYDRVVRSNNARNPDMYGEMPEGVAPGMRTPVPAPAPSVSVAPASPALLALGDEDSEPATAAILVPSVELVLQGEEIDGVSLGWEGMKDSASRSSSSAELMNLAPPVNTRYRD